MGGRRRKSGGGVAGRSGGQRSGNRNLLFADDAVANTTRLRGGEVGKKTGDRWSSRGNAFGYTYPIADEASGGGDPTGTILLPCSADADSPSVVAFVDPGPSTASGIRVPSYSYDPMVVGWLGSGFRVEEEEEEEEATGRVDSQAIGGVGLGFHGDEEDEDVVEEEEGAEGFDPCSTPVVKKEKKDEGFLSIGGIRVYTEDTSSPEEEEGFDESEEEDSDEEDGISVVGRSFSDPMKESPQVGEGDEEEDSSSEVEDESDIDDEVAADYMEGIGGSSELLGSGWLRAAISDSSDEDGLLKCGDSGNKDGRKLGGIGLLNASKKYGMKKPKSRKWKGNPEHAMGGFPLVDFTQSALEDFSLMKDIRSAGKKKKPSSHLSRSWPRESMNKHGTLPGRKKKQRKELIALKRRERMINRGVDLDQINYKLRHMVISEVDMLSLQPMHTRDCSQVQRLASIYQLRSDCQGSGKKRFVTVTRTKKTCLPSARDKLRLDKLLGAGIEDGDFTVNQDSNKLLKQRKVSDRIGKNQATKTEAEKHQSAPSKLTDGKTFGRRKQFGKQKLVSYAERPVSFVSSGVMQGDSSTETTAVDLTADTSCDKVTTSSSSMMGAFEMHTKGFGSRMMAKMGFVEGSGLGKNAQGIVQPIEAVQRPKSLGLGNQFSAETSKVEVRSTEVRSIGSFEKHTKGFGSKMMAKMGFVPGQGLGKDAQGIVNPLTAVKLPKSRGLGSKA